jgi:hypothetical protein
MDSQWFKEDRQLPKQEQAKAMAESEKALKNSTLLIRRLGIILEGMKASTLKDDEDFEKDGWERRAIANASKRKTINQILKLLP